MQSSFYINMIPNTSQEMEESYGTSSLRRRYLKNSTGKFTFAEEKRSGFHSVGHFFRTVFLPQGYPDSVSDDYLTYQIWDTIQAFASSITGTLAHQAVLKGYDGAGMMGRILFAWMQGTNLDCDAKRWRLFADIINDIAICLDILGPHFPAMFTFIVCVSGVLKSIVGVSGGATRAALTQHQARRNNMADVSAKDGSQVDMDPLYSVYLPSSVLKLLGCSVNISLSSSSADLAGENNTWSFADETFPRFLEDLSSHDWNTGVLLLGADEWRTHLGPGVASRHVKQL
ncbi:RUSF1-like protein [Mya arenaria]|uniref:RUSF1-like protein n=1 Tax=Mya arenaria TaxID=6604 RepID=A0ABY7DY64_MYAAR|nr:RUSF1-like protein [Mya arenaria]